MTKEIWKTHPCGLEVSNMGRVKVPQSGKHPEHITYGSSLTNGYKQVGYQGRYYRIHRLVAECFIPNPEGKETVDHINMVKDDNRVDNLRWASYKDQQNFEGQNVQKKKSKPVIQCSLDGDVIKVWPSTQECGRNGYDQSAVMKCCNNKFHRVGNNIYKGFVWQYAKEEVI